MTQSVTAYCLDPVPGDPNASFVRIKGTALNYREPAAVWLVGFTLLQTSRAHIAALQSMLRERVNGPTNVALLLVRTDEPAAAAAARVLTSECGVERVTLA